jgi:ribosomal protein S16
VKAVKGGSYAIVQGNYMGVLDSIGVHMRKKFYTPFKQVTINFNRENGTLRSSPITDGINDINLLGGYWVYPRKDVIPVLQSENGVAAIGLIPCGDGMFIFDGTNLYPRLITSEKGNKMLRNLDKFVKQRMSSGLAEDYEFLGLEGRVIGQFDLDTPWTGLEELKDVKMRMIVEQKSTSPASGRDIHWLIYNFLMQIPEEAREKMKSHDFNGILTEGIIHTAMPDSLRLQSPQKVFYSIRKNGKWEELGKYSPEELERMSNAMKLAQKEFKNIMKKGTKLTKDLLGMAVEREAVDTSERGITAEMENPYVADAFKKWAEDHIPFNLNWFDKRDFKEEIGYKDVALSIAYRTAKPVSIAGFFFKGKTMNVMYDKAEEGILIAKPSVREISREGFIGSNEELISGFQEKTDDPGKTPYDY